MKRRAHCRGRSPLLALLGIALLHTAAGGGGVPAWVEAARARATPAWAAAADALVLEDSQDVTFTRSGRTVTRTRWAVRVLGPTGAGAANASAEYLRGSGEVTSIEAWETNPKGVVRHLGGKDAVDVSAAGTWSLYSDARSLVLSAVDPVPETVFASETVVEAAPLFGEFHWSFDGQRPSLHSSFSITLPPGVEAVALPGTGAAPRFTREGQLHTWELGDLPPRSNEPLAPHRGDDGAVVYVALRSAPAPAGSQVARVPGATFADWPGVAKWLDQLESPQAAIAPAVAERARAIVGAERDTLRRLAALAREVQRTNYVSIELGLARGWGYQPHTAGEVLAAGYGDCKDKSNLLCALLRAAGHDAWMVSAYSAGRSHVVPERPTPSQFNHCIVAIRVPAGTGLPAAFRHPLLGEVVAFDPTDPLTAFGDLPESEQGSLALVDLPEGSDLVRLPVAPPEARSLVRTTRATLALDGRLEAHVEERSRGQAAVNERRLRRESDQRDYRQTLERWLAADRSSVALASFRTEEDSLAGTFHLALDFSAPGFARSLGPTMLAFRPAVLSPRTAFTLPDSARTRPIQLSAECFQESVTVALPEGMHPEELPAAIDRVTDFGRLHAEWIMAGGELRFVRSQVVQAVTLPAARYAEVRSFYALANKARNAPIVIVKG